MMNPIFSTYSYTENREFRLFLLKYIYDTRRFIKVYEDFTDLKPPKNPPLTFIKNVILQYKQDNSLRDIDISPERIAASPFDELYDFLKMPSPFDTNKEPFKTLNEIISSDILQIIDTISGNGLDEKESVELLKKEITDYCFDVIIQ